jgi:hypothetical protein
MTPSDLLRQLEVLRAKQLRLIADQDPTLTRLKQALATDRDLQQMDSRTLLAFCTDLEARFARGVEEGPR